MTGRGKMGTRTGRCRGNGGGGEGSHPLDIWFKIEKSTNAGISRQLLPSF